MCNNEALHKHITQCNPHKNVDCVSNIRHRIELFGTTCDMYTNKLDKAEDKATEYLKLYAEDIGADGIMEVRCQIDGLTFFICGTAYKENKPN